jgi:hypothetical protein
MELVGWPFHRLHRESLSVSNFVRAAVIRHVDAGGELSMAGGYQPG